MKAAGALARLDLVLVGGGHAHVSVLRSLGMRPEPGLRVTLIARELEAPYSGMLPGLIAGQYLHGDCHIDLVRLARFAGARLVHGSVSGIDRVARCVAIDGRPPLAFDLLSIDTGITPDLASIKGAAGHAVAVKPITLLEAKLAGIDAALAEGERRIVIVGAGAAGFELAHAFRHRTRSRRGQIHITLVGGGLLPSVNDRARSLARLSIAASAIELIEDDAVVEITKNQVMMTSGRVIPADAVLVTTGAAPAQWLRESGLALDAGGFVAVRPTLQVVGDDDIFAAGDCAGVIGHPREKSGVFPVRQGPPLTDNLRRRARGEAARDFIPQSRHLALLSTGGGSSIAALGRYAFAGRWVWTWKDWIDRRFVEKFNRLPVMAAESAVDMRCGGCAAKVGPVTLSRALDRLDRGRAARDDAAIVDEGGDELRLETIDFFRALWPEPYVFGAVAANHALNDIYAMGGTPRQALAVAVIAQGRARLVEEDLFQLLAGARSVFDEAGVTLAGGHSSEGAELAAGFSVSGIVARGQLRRKGGLRERDALVLTKPLGTGLLFAAEMRGLATAPAIAAALRGMQQSNREVARILLAHGASAMTDVTGFGLLGHLIEMLDQAGLRAVIRAPDIPAYPQARELAKAGIASSLLPENAGLAYRVEAPLRADVQALLFDPQTAGGLLVGIALENADRCVAELRAVAPEAAIIGEVAGKAEGAALVRVEG